MEQTTSLSAHGPSPRTVRWLQHLAAALLILPIVNTILQHFGIFLFNDGVDSYFKSISYSYVWDALKDISFISACLILILIASNRMTCTALKLGILWSLITCITNVARAYIYKSAVTDADIEVISDIIIDVIFTTNSVVWCYFYSIILRNNTLDTSVRSWIGLLSVDAVRILIINLNIGLTRIEGLNDMIFWVYSPIYKWFILMQSCIVAIAFFQYAHCEAFAGNYDPSPAPQGAYTPWNRCMAALVIGAAATVGALWLLYHYSTQM